MKEYKKDDRKEIIDRAIAVGKAAGYAAGARQATEDEGARVGRNAAISNVAKMLADTLGVSAKELLKDANSDILAMSKETKSGEEIAKDQEAEEKEKEDKEKAKADMEEEVEKAKEEAKEKAEEDAKAEKDMTPAELRKKKEQDKKAEEAEQALDESKAEQVKPSMKVQAQKKLLHKLLKMQKKQEKKKEKEATLAEAEQKQEENAVDDSKKEEKDASDDDSDKEDGDSDKKDSDSNDDSKSDDSINLMMIPNLMIIVIVMMIPNLMMMIVKMMMIKTKTKNIFINEKILNLYYKKNIPRQKTLF